MAPRGPKPKPTNLKVIENTDRRDRTTRDEPKPKSARPSPPRHLSDEAKAEWRRVCGELYNLGLLTNVDRAALAIYCQAYGRWEQAETAIAKMAEKDPAMRGLVIKTSNGNAIQNPLIGTANKAMADMMRYASEFGMTPSARSRISAEAPEESNDKSASYF